MSDDEVIEAALARWPAPLLVSVACDEFRVVSIGGNESGPASLGIAVQHQGATVTVLTVLTASSPPGPVGDEGAAPGVLRARATDALALRAAEEDRDPGAVERLAETRLDWRPTQLRVDDTDLGAWTATLRFQTAVVARIDDEGTGVVLLGAAGGCPDLRRITAASTTSTSRGTRVITRSS